MVYNASIPQPNDKVRISQAELLENFTKLNNVFNVDHVTFSDITGDGGKHSAATFVNRTDKGLVIPPATTAEEIALFVKDDAATIPRLFYQEPNSPVGAQIQISGSVKATANGECPLIGGLSLKWFTVAGVVGSGNTFLYTDVSLTPYITNTFFVVGNPITSAGNTVRAFNLANTGFSFTLSGQINSTVCFACIGI